MTYGEGKIPAYAVHTETEIKGFFGEYRWLSNFWPCNVWFDGVLYPSTEAAYQAAKIAPHHRGLFTCSTPAESKELWKRPDLEKIYTPEEWDVARYDVMMGIVFEKFYRHVELRQKLLLTGNANLEESNHWHDSYWGVDVRKGGRNNLGQILMIIRKLWSIQSK